VAHAFVDVHAAPCEHAVHTPVRLQAPGWLVVVVHEVPSGWDDVTVQTGEPVVHEYAAVAAHGWLEVQAPPHRRKSQFTRRTPSPLLVQSMV
jgi:hypothetical protein